MQLMVHSRVQVAVSGRWESCSPPTKSTATLGKLQAVIAVLVVMQWGVSCKACAPTTRRNGSPTRPIRCLRHRSHRMACRMPTCILMQSLCQQREVGRVGAADCLGASRTTRRCKPCALGTRPGRSRCRRGRIRHGRFRRRISATMAPCRSARSSSPIAATSSATRSLI